MGKAFSTRLYNFVYSFFVLFCTLFAWGLEPYGEGAGETLSTLSFNISNHTRVDKCVMFRQLFIHLNRVLFQALAGSSVLLLSFILSFVCSCFALSCSITSNTCKTRHCALSAITRLSQMITCCLFFYATTNLPTPPRPPLSTHPDTHSHIRALWTVDVL